VLVHIASTGQFKEHLMQCQWMHRHRKNTVNDRLSINEYAFEELPVHIDLNATLQYDNINLHWGLVLYHT